MDIIAVLFIIAVLVVLFFVEIGWTVNELAKTVLHANNKKRMFRSLENTLLSYYKSSETTKCFKEIDFIFKHIVNNDELLIRYFSNTGILLEKYLICLNANDTKIVNPNVDDKVEYKKYILGLIEEYERKNPMDSIKGANNVLLNQLIECMEKIDHDKFHETINQLAIEIKNLQDEVFERDKAKRKQDIISIIGIVLSVVFGIMTTIQLFK